MEQLQLFLFLMFIIAVTGVLAKQLSMPLPILQVLFGLLLSHFPGLEELNLDPAVFFLLFIPPLLFSDSWLIAKREFFRYCGPILRLAIGLVFLTTWVTGYLVTWLFPEVPLSAAFVLGAAISPTDAVAVSAIIGKYKIPSRITYILNGESLVNDASALVAFKFALAAVLTGTFSFYEATENFFLLVAGGVTLGYLSAWLIGRIRLGIRRRKLSEPFIQMTLSLLTPFVAYLVAEYFKVSGILAVVTAGFYSGITDAAHMSRDTRMHSWEVWRLLLYILNGAVFILLGLTLPKVILGMHVVNWNTLILKSLFIAASVIVVRMLWVFATAYAVYWIGCLRNNPKNPIPNIRSLILAGWCGIRGAITLAAALSIPLVVNERAAFPSRDLLIFLGAVIIIVTFMLQNLFTPLLMRKLRLRPDGIAEKEEHTARIKILSAAIETLEEYLERSDRLEEQNQAAKIAEEYNSRLIDLSEDPERITSAVEKHKTEKHLRLLAVRAQRKELHHLHNTRVINEVVLRLIERELDYEEAFLKTF